MWYDVISVRIQCLLFTDICYKHLCEDCKKKPNFDGSTEYNKVGCQLKSRGNSAQTADLNKTSRKQRTTMNKTGEDWHRYTLPSLAKQNENQTSRQHGSMLLSKRIWCVFSDSVTYVQFCQLRHAQTILVSLLVY